MLHFILGKAVSGKTEYLHKKLGEIIDSGKQSAVLIVPEQFTFETDKGILGTLGAVKANKIEVLSFTRAAENIFATYGIKHKDIISDQGRLLYMSMTLSSLEEKLVLYKKHINNPSFAKSMLFVVDELKQSVARKNLESSIKNIKSETLRDKMRELLLICDTYDAIIENSFLDTADVLQKLCDALKDNRHFEGMTVAFDGFTSFNAQIMKIIEQILLQADDVYITLCADGLNYDQTENDVFAFTRRTASRLKQLAKKNNIPIAKPVILTEEITGYKRYADSALYALEENLYKPVYSTYEGNCDCTEIYCAGNIEDECVYVSRKIRQLMREGYRCRDIAVIYRDSNKYEMKLKYAFKKYEIPTFEDARQPILNQPLVLYLQNALIICADGLNTESILRLLKTGLTALSVDEISELENYVYIWSIDGAKWKSEFTMNPFGFNAAKQEKQDEILEKIEKSRKTVIEPLLDLRENIKDKDGYEITKAIYEFLISTKSDRHLKNLAIELEEAGESALALEQEQIWDILMQTLNEMALALKDKHMNAKKYLELFNLALSTKTLGRVPNAVDEVIVGAAERIRARGVKVAFVLGANTGVFPAISTGTGVLTDRDRTALLSAGIELFDVRKYKSIEERFIAYHALCCAKERLYLSYALSSDSTSKSGDEMSPSELVTMTQDILPSVKCKYSTDVKNEEKIEGETASFELLASLYRRNDYYSQNLLHYFEKLPKYEEKVKALKRVSGSVDFEIEDKQVALDLFGKNIRLSASKIEEYEKCPFKYFCRYGLKANPREKATIDPRQNGNIIHDVLALLLEKYKEIGVENTDAAQRTKDITDALRLYAEKNLGGLENKDKRFVYQFNQIARTLDILFERIVAEFENSKFVPVDFELTIGKGADSKIPPYVVDVPDGSQVVIVGAIDRVDKFDTDDARYIRVIDYKTGNKKLLLGDVMNGLNIQMLVYLFAIIKGGKDYYGDNILPAGVLYFPARAINFNSERNDSDETVKRAMYKESAMNGLVLNDEEIIEAMDSTDSSIFLPASIDKKTGKAKGSIISLKQLEALNERIDKIISDMAFALHEGKIPALPIREGGENKLCTSCEYRSVCCHEKEGKYRALRFSSSEKDGTLKCLNILDGGDENEQ